MCIIADKHDCCGKVCLGACWYGDVTELPPVVEINFWNGGEMPDVNDSAFLDIPQLAVNVEDLNTALIYIGRLQEYADFLTSDRMAAVNAETSPDENSIGTPFGGFDDARAQWAALQTATSGMHNSLLVLQEKLAALKLGTETIMQSYRDVEARTAATAAQIESALGQGAAEPGNGQSKPNVG
jgi:hypothetical protein